MACNYVRYLARVRVRAVKFRIGAARNDEFLLPIPVEIAHSVGACRVRLYRCIAQFTRGSLRIQILPVVGRRGVVWGRKGIQKSTLALMNVLISAAVPVWFATIMA